VAPVVVVAEVAVVARIFLVWPFQLAKKDRTLGIVWIGDETL
jgi:hypothetical protein